MALCGSSDALSSLQKHTSVDRSLQQDKTSNLRASSSQQSFRGVSGAAYLQNEFDHFAGVAQDSQLLQRATPPLQQSSAPSWAIDFRRLGISNGPGPSPFQTLQPVQSLQQLQPWAAATPAPLMSSSNWQADFLQQVNNNGLVSNAISHAPTQFQQQPMSQSFLHTPQSFIHSHLHHIDNSQSFGYQQNQPLAHVQKQEQGSDAAFDLAFEQASMWQFESQHDELDSVSSKVVAEEEVTEGKKESLEKEEEADELAKTAGQLLESLSGEQNRKFQQSTFLALMRKLRDKEVKVQGDRMVEVEVR